MIVSTGKNIVFIPTTANAPSRNDYVVETRADSPTEVSVWSYVGIGVVGATIVFCIVCVGYLIHLLRDI